MTGSRPVNLEKEWGDVESFVNELRSALDEEAKTIRETELDQDGEYCAVSIRVPSEDKDWVAKNLDAFVDRMGRVFLPPRPGFDQVISVTFLEEENGSKASIRKVTRTETRFRGDRVVAYVLYVEE